MTPLDILGHTETNTDLSSTTPTLLVRERGGGGGSAAVPLRGVTSSSHGKKNDDNNNNNNNDPPVWQHFFAGAAVPPFLPLAWKTLLGITVALYVLNQKHLLPKPLSGVVSKALFWPTLPITLSRRIGRWVTPVDGTVVMGGAPLRLLRMPTYLHDRGVRGVVNLCDEYPGPGGAYERLGMEELRLKTVDHFEPSLEDLKSAVQFIQDFRARGERVYVHCRAGHGRSAAVVLAWKMATAELSDSPTFRQSLNEEMSQLRNVRTKLWKQPNLKRYHRFLLEKEGKILGEDDGEGDEDLNDTTQSWTD